MTEEASLYAVLAEFAEPKSAGRSCQGGPCARLRHGSTRSRPSLLRACPRQSASASAAFRARCWPAGVVGAILGFLMQVGTNLDFPLWVGGRPLHRGPGLHAHHIRADGARSGHVRHRRLAGPEPAAAAEPSAVRRRPLRPRHRQPVLSRHPCGPRLRSATLRARPLRRSEAGSDHRRARRKPGMKRAALLGLCLAGCHENMVQQPRADDYETSSLFADGKVLQAAPDGTVARDAPAKAAAAARRPPTSMALLERGRERYAIFCVECHGADGRGDGVVVARGYPAPPSFPGAAIARRAQRLCLRRYHPRLRRDVRLCGASRARRIAGRSPLMCGLCRRPA